MQEKTERYTRYSVWIPEKPTMRKGSESKVLIWEHRGPTVGGKVVHGEEKASFKKEFTKKPGTQWAYRVRNL